MLIMPYKLLPFTLAFHVMTEPVDSGSSEAGPDTVFSVNSSGPKTEGPTTTRDSAISDFEPKTSEG